MGREPLLGFFHPKVVKTCNYIVVFWYYMDRHIVFHSVQWFAVNQRLRTTVFDEPTERAISGVSPNVYFSLLEEIKMINLNL
jgi:hypothetical protein